MGEPNDVALFMKMNMYEDLAGQCDEVSQKLTELPGDPELGAVADALATQYATMLGFSFQEREVKRKELEKRLDLSHRNSR